MAAKTAYKMAVNFFVFNIIITPLQIPIEQIYVTNCLSNLYIWQYIIPTMFLQVSVIKFPIIRSCAHNYILKFNRQPRGCIEALPQLHLEMKMRLRCITGISTFRNLFPFLQSAPQPPVCCPVSNGPSMSIPVQNGVSGYSSLCYPAHDRKRSGFS